MTKQKKILVGVMMALIVLIAVAAVIPMIVSAVMGPGVQTKPMDASRAEPATTSIDGHWSVAQGRGSNTTSVGYTFPEVLPGDHRVTSGSTQKVSGELTVESGRIVSGFVEIDLDTLESDNQRRDINVQMKVFDTVTYPTARFDTTEPVDVSSLPDDGTPGTVTVPGKLTIKGTTKAIEPTFDAVRDGERVIVSGTIPINRLDYGVETPDFIAATISEDGELNIRLALEKKEG